MSSASLLAILSILALSAWAPLGYRLAVRPRTVDPRTAEVRECLRRSDQAEAVWRYVAEHHAFDPATDLCVCGGRYLLCPDRIALHEYANHLLAGDASAARAENSAPVRN
jgi:hypothetical protein